MVKNCEFNEDGGGTFEMLPRRRNPILNKEKEKRESRKIFGALNFDARNFRPEIESFSRLECDISISQGEKKERLHEVRKPQIMGVPIIFCLLGNKEGENTTSQTVKTRGDKL